MARDSQRLEQELIATARDKTGKDVPEWMTVIAASGQDKPNALIAWLKSEYQLNHMQAQFLTGIYLNGGQPVYDYEIMFQKLFAGKDALMPTYQALEGAIRGDLPGDVDLIPTKTYVSIEGKRCFACATLTKQNIRVGLDLDSTPFDDYAQKAKSLGAMPNLTHMVEIVSPADVNPRLIGLMRQAYDNAHSK